MCDEGDASDAEDFAAPPAAPAPAPAPAPDRAAPAAAAPASAAPSRVLVITTLPDGSLRRQLIDQADLINIDELHVRQLLGLKADAPVLWGTERDGPHGNSFASLQHTKIIPLLANPLMPAPTLTARVLGSSPPPDAAASAFDKSSSAYSHADNASRGAPWMTGHPAYGSMPPPPPAQFGGPYPTWSAPGPAASAQPRFILGAMHAQGQGGPQDYAAARPVQ